MRNFTTIIIIGLSALLIQCETSNQHSELTAEQPVLRSSTGIKNPILNRMVSIELDDAVVKFIDQWTSFFILKGEVDNMISNNPTLFDKTPNDIKPIFDNLDIGIPELFDNSAIWARFKVLETEVYNYNNQISTNNNSIEGLKSNQDKIVTAYYNLVLQINKIHEKSTQIEFN